MVLLKNLLLMAAKAANGLTFVYWIIYNLKLMGLWKFIYRVWFGGDRGES
jgi:hypothetical protein